MKHVIFKSASIRFLIVAGVIHLTLTTTIFLIGHFQLMPNTFDERGVGLTFAIDGTSYQRVGSRLAEELDAGGIGVWINMKAPFHSRLYSLSFATLGKLLGHNVLAAEPLNLFYYLAILSCIYFLGHEIFDAQTGFLAATIVALWPSFLLHSTQLMRDSLTISCFLALMVVLTLVLSREFSWHGGVAVGLAGAIVTTLFWVVRGNMWNAVLAALGIALIMLAARMVRARKLMTGNSIVMLLMIAAALLVPARLESTTLPGVRPPTTPLAIPSDSQPTASKSIWANTVGQIGARRGGFRFYQSHASNIDAEVQFKSTGDIVRFVPRAFAIGFFAPFPRMWFKAGSFGRAGRLLSGLETLAMYFLYLAVGICLWHERRNLPVWLVFLVAAIGMLALGLVVVNAGALYRIRYVFWMMLIVLAAHGILNHFTVLRTNLTKLRMSSSVVSNDAIKRTSEISSFQT